MSLNIILILIAIGLFAGVFSGLVGLGGGVIMIPAMLYLLSMNQYQAQGTSLAVMLPPIGLFAAYNYYKAGHVDWRYALIIALAFLIGGYFGSKIAISIPVETLKKVFGFVMIAMALQIIFGK